MIGFCAAKSMVEQSMRGCVAEHGMGEESVITKEAHSPDGTMRFHNENSVIFIF